MIDLEAIKAQRGNKPVPPGTYEESLAAMERALEEDAPPSPEHIKINNRLVAWEAYLGIAKVKSFPTQLHVGLNDVCNARCAFCQYAPERSTANMIKADDLRRAKWLKYVRSFFPNAGLSEPLIHPEIEEIFEIVRDNAPHINMHLTTNVSLVSDRLLPVLVSNLNLMIISLNAARKETYEFLMPPLKWDRILRNLERIQEEKARQGRAHPELQAGYVLNKHNLDELPELPALLKSIGFTGCRIIELKVPEPIKSRELLTKDDVASHDKAHALKKFAEFESECRIHNIRLTQPLPAF